MQQTNDKKIYFEVMRVIAVGLVIFNHIDGYTLYQVSSGSAQWFYMFLTMITRINVPLFFMISGALLLRKQEEFPLVLKKRVLRFLLLLIVFGGAAFCHYKIIACMRGTEYDFSLKHFVGGLLSGDLDGLHSYWYLYAYLGILLTLPFMQRIARGMKKEDFWLLIGLHFIFTSAVPIFNIFFVEAGIGSLNISGSFSVPFATAKQFFYPLIGYYLEYYVDVTKLKKMHVFGLLATAFTGILLSSVCTYWEGSSIGTYTQNYVQLFDYVTAIVAFLVIKYMVLCVFPGLAEGKAARVISYVGSLTLGIYLLDPFFRRALIDRYESVTEPILPTLMVSAGWVCFSMIMGGVVTAILKKIPGIKKLI